MLLSSAPLILIPADTLFAEGQNWYSTSQQYIMAACKIAQLQPLIVPLIANTQALEGLLQHIDGILIPGARSNVHPQNYSSVAQKMACPPYDEQRDANAFYLIQAALERDLPLLAICRGLQELNVVLGGTLCHNVQEQKGRMDHRAQEDKERVQQYQLCHTVSILPNTLLAAILNKQEAQVNSLHCQAINTLGRDLRVEAVAPDGTVEAISYTKNKNFNLAVQWHPEYWVETDETSNKIFMAFRQAVYAHQKNRLKT